MIESIKYIREKGSYLLFEIEGASDTIGWCWGDMVWTDGDVIEVSANLSTEDLYDWKTTCNPPTLVYNFIKRTMMAKGYF